jgi:hypothetical protein
MRNNDKRVWMRRVLENEMASPRAMENPPLAIEASNDFSATHRSEFIRNKRQGKLK